jgi:hypothetical protein
MRQAEVTSRVATVSLDRVGFAVWSTAFAVGVVLHEWQKGAPPVSWHTVSLLLALGVILRPAAVGRTMLLLGSLAVELASEMPDPWNHGVIAGVGGGAVALWWLGLFARSPSRARDCGYVYRRITPFLRVAFILAFAAAAFSKLNTGFFESIGGCATWIMESIPLVTVPVGLRPVLTLGAVLIEFAIPVLLIFRRSRPIAIVLGFGFHALSSLAGHTAFAGFAWSFYLIFLPSGVLARAAVQARRLVGSEVRHQVSAINRSPWSWVGLAVVALIALTALDMLSPSLQPLVRRWGAAIPYLAYSAVWFVLLARIRGQWLHLRGDTVPRDALRVRSVLLLAALGLLVVNAASPYLGLKTRYSFTMYSNLHTEAGYWNHLVVPESVRVFDQQDRLVRLTQVSDPRLVGELEFMGGETLPLPAVQRLAAEYPAAIVSYEIDGQVRTAAPFGDDATLGLPASPLLDFFGGFRPVESDNRCLH